MDSARLISGSLACVLFLCGQPVYACPALTHKLKPYSETLFRCQLFPHSLSIDSTYFLKDKNHSFATKIFDKGRSPKKRSLIIAIAQHMAQNQLGPSVLWVPKDHSFFIMDYLQGKPLFQLTGHEKSLGLALKKIHTHLTEKFARDLSAYSLIDRTFNRLKEVGSQKLLPPSTLKKIRIYLNELRQKQNPERVGIHADLKGHNIFQTPQGLRFLDWGDASLSSPYDDLGSLHFFLSPSPQQTEALLTEYLGTCPTIQQKMWLSVHSKIASIHFALWCLRISRKLFSEKRPPTKDYHHLKQYVLKQYARTLSPLILQKLALSLLNEEGLL